HAAADYPGKSSTFALLWVAWRSASGPIPTFASLPAGTFANVGRRTTDKTLNSSGALDLTFASRVRGLLDSERQIRSTSVVVRKFSSFLPRVIQENFRTKPH
ncbi:MAG TPA: hypothetical protein VGH70_04880, partial [Bradyrhizobium sp.]